MPNSSTVKLHTQHYSPFEKAAHYTQKNESEHLTNQQHETLKNATYLITKTVIKMYKK